MKINFKYIFLSFLMLFANLVLSQQSLQWAKSLSGYGLGMSVVTDNLGNVYTIGNFTGTVDFDPGPGVYNVTASGNNDLFLTKFNLSGNLISVRTTEGTAGSSINPNSIKIDANGDIVICGFFSGKIDFDPGIFSNFMVESGSSDCFVLKWDANGNFIWSRQIGANNNYEYFSSVDLDNFGNIYLTGAHNGTIDLDPGPGTFTIGSLGLKDAFVMKLDYSGNYQWGCNFGSTLDDGGSAIKFDGMGGIWSTGYFANVIDFDPSSSSYTLSPGNNYGVYFSRLDMNGSFLVAKALTPQIGGSMAPFGLTVDGSGNIYGTGYFYGTADFDPDLTAYNLTSNGLNDVFVSKLDINGTLVWAKNFGGSNIDVGRSIVLDGQNHVYITGNFNGTSEFDPSAGSYSLTSIGSDDVFVNKLDVNGNFLCASSMGSVSGDMGLAIHVDINQDVLITGYFQNTADFDPGPLNYTITPIGVFEPFICKYKQNFIGAPLSYTICSGSSTTLTGLGVNSYTWFPSQGLSSINGTTVLASPTVSTTYTVFGTNGCINTSTIINITVLPKPNLLTQAGPINLICDPDSVLLQSSSTNTNVLFQWRKQTSITYSNQPFYAKVPGPYYSKVTSLSTGCSDSSIVVVNNLKIYPNSKIVSHNYISALVPIDTVTCYSPSISVIGASDTSGVVLTWKSFNTNTIYSNPISVTSLGNYKLFVKRNDNNCIDSSLIALVNQNTNLPSINTNTNNLEINCSIYNATLSSTYSPSNCIVNWLSPSMNLMTNPSVVNQIGKYKFTATDPQNGCSRLDSVNVIQTNELLLKSSNDSTVCKNSMVSLSSIAIGTVANITYSWSNSQTGSLISINPNTTTNYYVYANSASGCYGSDTIKINIPSDIQDSVITFRSCSNNTLGTIVVFAKGGIAPYKYSINDGNTFFNTNTFQNIPFGNYQILIKDSIGCTKQINVTLNSNSNLPVPKFLASTKNFRSDTLVFVDISIPKPDSVHWVLPTIANIIGGDMFNPIVVFSDTGSFNVTMRSYYGNCIINASKIVKFSPYDSLVANQYNANGIKTFSLYPNPNNGIFTLFVEFYKKQDATVQIWDVNSYNHYQQNFTKVQSITLPIDISFLLNGTYMLRIIGEYDAKYRSFIISK